MFRTIDWLRLGPSSGESAEDGVHGSESGDVGVVAVVGDPHSHHSIRRGNRREIKKSHGVRVVDNHAGKLLR